MLIDVLGARTVPLISPEYNDRRMNERHRGRTEGDCNAIAGAEGKCDAYALLSVAVSLDGCIGLPGYRPLTISSEEDRDAIDRLRSFSDAILIGAGTARSDDPRLGIRSAARRTGRVLSDMSAEPARVVITASGDLSTDLRMFRTDGARTMILTSEARIRSWGGDLPAHVELISVEPLTIAACLRRLSEMGMRRVMIEGGARISGDVLRSGCAEALRISVSPMIVGSQEAPRIHGGLPWSSPERIAYSLHEVEALGDTAVLHWIRNGLPHPSAVFQPRSDAQWLAEAIELSKRCTISAGAFSVGAIIVSASGQVLSESYSREISPSSHAEEGAIARARAGGHIIAGATLYSSLEPCSVRLSGRKPCVNHIREAGITRVVFAASEPATFVQCDGKRLLEAAGIEVMVIERLAFAVAEVNAHVWPHR